MVNLYQSSTGIVELMDFLVVKPKVHLHSFAFASSEEDGDVLFVGKDGIINIAPITNTLSVR